MRYTLSVQLSAELSWAKLSWTEQSKASFMLILNGKQTDFENQLRVVKQSIWLRWNTVDLVFRLCCMFLRYSIERRHH